MKLIFKGLVSIAIFIGILVVGRNLIVRLAVEKGVQAAAGTPLKIRELDLGLRSTHIGIKDLYLYNPPGFPDEAMFYVSEIFAEYNLAQALRGKIHLRDMRLNFDRLVIVKNKEGQINIEALKRLQEKGPASSGEEKPGSQKAPDIQIDHVSMKVGKVVYKDYSKGQRPSVKEFNINLSEELTDVTGQNLNWLVLYIANKAVMKTTLSSFIDFNIDAITNPLGVPQTAVDVLKGTTDVLKGAAGTLKDKIKLPFTNR